MTKREKGKIKVGSFYKKMEEQGVRVRHRQRKRERGRKKERKKERTSHQEAYGRQYSCPALYSFWVEVGL